MLGMEINHGGEDDQWIGKQCCGSGTGSGSARIRNFLQDPDPELEVMDPELDLNLTGTKIYQKMSNLIIMTLKIH
jgi:hypothetical protein